MEMEMERPVDWTLLPVDPLRCISERLADPLDFICFRAVCPAWREAVPHNNHRRFQPWIVESDLHDDSGNVVFYSPVSDERHLIHVRALEGRRVAGWGAGLLVGVDTDDELLAVVVNPLTGVSTELPRLPELFRGTFTFAFATDPDMTGEDHVVVVVYNRLHLEGGHSTVALWRRFDAAGWATMPLHAFRMRMPQLRNRLLTHGPQLLEAEEAAAAAVPAAPAAPNVLGGAWRPGLPMRHFIEHEGQVRILIRWEQPANVGDAPEGPVRPGDRLLRVVFQLRTMVGADMVVIDWAHAPELHDKIILMISVSNNCYVIPESDHFVGLSKNFIYFFSWLRHEEAGADGGGGGGNHLAYFLCKWDVLNRIATVVEKVHGIWDQEKNGRWFLPTLKY
ncbi:hypothetical protein BS78_03G174000 [Paspalum vaginatum]|nr:hypothetical protein BS78_03G174000 [Paspalum vaginatum]